MQKPIPGSEWVYEKSRATFEPDYGSGGKVWVDGAFEPVTREVTFVPTGKRDSARHIQVLEKVIHTFPADHLLIIEDNLSSHHSRDTKIALAAWPEIQILFLPKLACWLYLIEPWWKQLKSFALKGRRFEGRTELETALWDALDYWNNHCYPYRWKKKPQEQLPSCGGFSFSKVT